MKFHKVLMLVTAGSLAGLALAGLDEGSARAPFHAPRTMAGLLPSADGIEILTYNVHGLPWPIVDPRSSQLRAIGRRLAELHREGRAPQVAVIQEAFTVDAKALADTAGYRYAVIGPGITGSPAPILPFAEERSLLRGARWSRGEDMGKWEGSGLMLLSDYPVVRVRRFSFASDACAGFDCLAAKGALLATLQLPGGGRFEVATAHLNSRRASGVDDGRSDRAWLIEAAELRDFIAQGRDPAVPLVLAGDFNVGRVPARQRGIETLVEQLDRDAADGLRSLASNGNLRAPDAVTALRRAKDWEISLAGQSQALSPATVSVPFGSDGGAPLSDHFGYAIGYRLTPALGRRHFAMSTGDGRQS